MASIKPILDSTKIALEKEASDRFGAAVEEFTRGTIGRVLNIPDGLPGSRNPVNRNDGSFYATSYAHALAGGTSYRPKLKFLFKVEFVFTDEAMNAFPSILGRANNNDFTFMVKSVDRPKIDFEYEDDVNMYNFRTKVLKKIRHRELTITFMDDSGNRVLDFFRALMMIYSPITRRQLIRQNGSVEERLQPPDAYSATSGTGMQFTPLNAVDKNDTSMRGAVNSSVGSLIQTIRVKQFYVNPGEQLGASTQEVIFDFLNARLVSFDLDDLNHEVSETNTLTMQFDYDWMEIVNVGPLSTMDGPKYNITVPGVGGAPVDMTVVGGAGALTNPGRGNPFANIITNQIGRAAQQITSTAISRGVASIAGNGRFASLVGSQVSNILGGIVGAGARSIASGGLAAATASVNQGIAGATNVIRDSSVPAVASTRVIDSAEAGPADVISVVTSTRPNEGI